jgi:GT2 family glycosyltransferase
MRSCLSSIKEHTSSDYRIYIAYNGTDNNKLTDLAAFIKSEFTKDQIHFLKYDYYNFAKLNNDILKNHLHDDVDVVVFCNNDIVLKTPCIDEIAKTARENKDRVGTVGCRLLFADDTIQHDGQFLVVHKEDNTFVGVSHICLKTPINDAPKREHIETRIGNTFALCGIHRQIIDDIGHLNENYQYCFEDVEFNLQCLKDRRINVILPSNNWAYHLESATRSETQNDNTKFLQDANRIALFVNVNFKSGHPEFIVR